MTQPPVTQVPLCAIELTHLTVDASEGRGRAATRHGILADVSIHLPKGGAVGIVGESGSGKSTLVRAMMDLLPATMTRTQGTYLLDGQERWIGRADERREMLGSVIGYIPQDPLSSLHPALPIFDQVTEVVRLHSGRRFRYFLECLRGYFWRVRPAATEAQAAQMLRQVGIDGPESKVRQFPHEFSGGMRQRVLIASALAGQPSILFADEPTTALDASVERRILDLINDIRVERGLSVVLVSHDLNVVSWMCDYAYVLYRGHVVEEGPVEDLFRRPRHPYTQALVNATPGQLATHDELTSPDEPDEVAGQVSAAADPYTTGCVYRHRCPWADQACAAAQPALLPIPQRPGAAACVHPLDGADR